MTYYVYMIFHAFFYSTCYSPILDDFTQDEYVSTRDTMSQKASKEGVPEGRGEVCVMK
ncbi:MAG TPA: hypothetical protein PK358_15920 [Spirochaetota bacterium]|nr:hypothetical protein [Spirochaetota bacterium]HPJ36327.1 hypothetical protein [Spirochaetota bacterium]